MKRLMVLLLALMSAAAFAAPDGMTGLRVPKGWEKTATFDDIAPRMASLPERFDWNEYCKLQPIRDQASCGSCWAFSITAVIESLHRLIHPELFPVIDLAEQTLVSSCERGGDCGGGYFDAFDYTRDSGLPIEADDPYRASNSSCKSNLHAFAKVTRWAYIGSSGKRPTTDQLKQAILDHGPISVDVNGSFNYDSGVYTSCGGTGTNHMVVLDGWIDDQAYAQYGGGYWIMRNSWGAGWGEKGYMRIVYKSKGGSNCNGIGQMAAYAVMDGVENLREHLGVPLPVRSARSAPRGKSE